MSFCDGDKEKNNSVQFIGVNKKLSRKEILTREFFGGVISWLLGQETNEDGLFLFFRKETVDCLCFGIRRRRQHRNRSFGRGYRFFLRSFLFLVIPDTNDKGVFQSRCENRKWE